MRFLDVLDAVRSSGFRDLSGSHTVATISVAEPLLNALLAASVSPRGPVREVSVHPQPGDRLAVRAKLARPEFLPPLNATVAIERQPDLPGNPVLGLRITGLAGFLALAAPLRSIAPRLPRGFRLDGDRLTVDLRELLADGGHDDLLGLMKRVSIHSEEGRVVIDLEARIG